MGKYTPALYQPDHAKYQNMITDTLPGQKSQDMHARAAQYYRGLSDQAKLFPGAFESGCYCMMRNVDGSERYGSNRRNYCGNRKRTAGLIFTDYHR